MISKYRQIIFTLLLPVAFAIGGRGSLRAQDYVRQEELEAGYGMIWLDSYGQDIPEPPVRLYGADVSSDGRWLAYTEEGILYVKDLQADTVATIDFPGYRPRWSPDSRTLHFSNYKGGLDFWHPLTGQRDSLSGRDADSNVGLTDDTWGPDGNIYFRNFRWPGEDRLWRILLDSSFDAGYLVFQPISNSFGPPAFPPNTTDWYVIAETSSNSDSIGFNIVTNFDRDHRRFVRIPIPDTSWLFASQNIWRP